MKRKMTSNSKRGRACVVVLGDIGRSPRMQYHALSLANQANFEVDIVGYGGSTPHAALVEHQSIHVYRMKPILLQGLPKVLKPLVLLLKPLIQFVMLLWYLCVKLERPDIFLVQNPPSVPTLMAVKWASWLRNSAFIIDWHNFGYTLMALSVGRNSRFVVVYRWLDKSITQPPGIRDCVSVEKSALENETLFATMAEGHIIPKPDRPALVVSSTSWTPDEDFGILLEAAVMYDRRVTAILNENDNVYVEVPGEEISGVKEIIYPRLLFVITGKGPEKEKYEEKIKRLRLKHVAFRTMWLSAEDYPLLLGSADLGVCLHTSSSGLDLPMKMLFEGFPGKCNNTLASLRKGAMEAGSSRWVSEWEEHAKPLIQQARSILQLQILIPTSSPGNLTAGGAIQIEIQLSRSERWMQNSTLIVK
ncbi:UDP-glycosyltransferase TURAN [Linum grandiflorum]